MGIIYTQKETHKAFVELGILHNLELLFAIWLRTIAKTFDTTTYKKNFNSRFHIVYPKPYYIMANMRKYIPKNLVIGRQAQKSHMFRIKTGQSMIRTQDQVSSCLCISPDNDRQHPSIFSVVFITNYM